MRLYLYSSIWGGDYGSSREAAQAGALARYLLPAASDLLQVPPAFSWTGG